MVQIEDSLAYLSENIGYIVTIIGAFFVGTKYVISEIHKKHDRLKKEIMGPEGNAKEGKGGAIDDFRTEVDRKLAAMELRLEAKINDNHQKLLNELRISMQKLNFVVSNISRMERSLEKMMDGRYTSARLTINKEDGYNETDNPDPDDESYREQADSFNKKKRERRG